MTKQANYLLQATTGVVRIYTEDQAKRQDMVPISDAEAQKRLAKGKPEPAPHLIYFKDAKDDIIERKNAEIKTLETQVADLESQLILRDKTITQLMEQQGELLTRVTPKEAEEIKAMPFKPVQTATEMMVSDIVKDAQPALPENRDVEITVEDGEEDVDINDDGGVVNRIMAMKRKDQVEAFVVTKLHSSIDREQPLESMKKEAIRIARSGK